ncbi:MAG: hypothetical protein AAB381_03550 [Patescibacteria group bacterium]
MKYVSIAAGLILIGLLIVAFVNKQDATVTPQTTESIPQVLDETEAALNQFGLSSSNSASLSVK